MSTKRNALPLKITPPAARTEIDPDAERRFLEPAETSNATSAKKKRWKDSKLRRDITDTERLQVYVPAVITGRLRLCGAKERRSQSDIVTAALEQYLGSREL
jgi:hypothetical protein